MNQKPSRTTELQPTETATEQPAQEAPSSEQDKGLGEITALAVADTESQKGIPDSMKWLYPAMLILLVGIFLVVGYFVKWRRQ